MSPGSHKAGGFGIRTENLIHVIESPVGNGFMEFETLTLVPIETRHRPRPADRW